MRTRAFWLQNYLEDLSPWDTDQGHSSIRDCHTQKRYLSLAHPQRITSTTETQSQRSHYSLLRRYPTLKSLSQNNHHSRNHSISDHNSKILEPKCSEKTTRTGQILKQLKIKHFTMSGKENRVGLVLKQRLGRKKESNFILKQKYANLRCNSRFHSSKQQTGISLININR